MHDTEALEGCDPLDQGPEARTEHAGNKDRGSGLEDRPRERELRGETSSPTEDARTADLPSVEGGEGEHSLFLKEKKHARIATDGVVFKHRKWIRHRAPSRACGRCP